ncbi:thioredoxin domain-containing protein [Corynebacterium sp.]|uniref:DsbA family protein n=1 Tax=Corynebacterium sp. TaxID=1720 RepID=UPI0026DB27A9|nr:thioredoxin domain-containing protein [Corynebacterium sp.]MDO5077788.1 thioredoxin domain-containing protein [Corynebacterium sp.]
MWAFLAGLVIIAGLGGYVLGERSGGAAGSATTAAGSQQPAGDRQATQKLKVPEPGKGPTTATAAADGTYDATIYGPGGDLQSQDDILKVHRRNAKDPFAIGPLDAPVVISEFSDFECPFCSRFANTTEHEILEQYVEKGLVRMEWNDLPVNGPNAIAAAQAGRAAAAQGKFREFKKALYTASKDISGHPNFTIDDFMKFAEQANVPDLERFRKQATDATFTAAVEGARDYAAGIGVNGTPGFVVGTRFISGAQPAEVFHQAIAEELDKVARGEVAAP